MGGLKLPLKTKGFLVGLGMLSLTVFWGSFSGNFCDRSMEGYVTSFLGCDFQWRMVVLANRHLEPQVDEELTVGDSTALGCLEDEEG